MTQSENKKIFPLRCVKGREGLNSNEASNATRGFGSACEDLTHSVNINWT